MSLTFPGESAAYRVARNRLLEQEIELRRSLEAAAAARRRLPPGGLVLGRLHLRWARSRWPSRQDPVLGAVRARQELADRVQLYVPAQRGTTSSATTTQRLRTGRRAQS
jgi:hypothetical protein